ncbi:unnamed protein product [Cylicocyclus nassatus]|uniref:pyridoxal 5'-phosphate synthase n=1 Tax=Cylicocyclus nassatus TaxID=53992 RepID=A0AA36M6M2_CYLNA|nr:unnamed protein product [Cylicocyclus nassatus]
MCRRKKVTVAEEIPELELGLRSFKRFSSFQEVKLKRQPDVMADKVNPPHRYETSLMEDTLPTRDPQELLKIWRETIARSKTTSDLELNACCLCTVGRNMQPSSRIIMPTSYTAEGISFFCNYDSRKGRELEENPRASMLFYWPTHYKQVRLEGGVWKLTVEEAELCWKSLPLSLRIGYKVSEHCSSVVQNKQCLQDKRKALEKLAATKGEAAITRLETFGGYIFKPDYFEFWQGQSDHIDDRLEFYKTNGTWLVQRLSP